MGWTGRALVQPALSGGQEKEHHAMPGQTGFWGASARQINGQTLAEH